MNRRFDSPLFWGNHSPFSSLCGAGLIILSSSRFAFAIISAGAIIWVYALTALVFSSGRPIIPARGKMIILLFLSAFFCGFFMLLLGLFNPLLILGSGFFLFLVPPFILGSEFFENADGVDLFEVISRALLEAAVVGGIILALALIREPLGMGTLSLPGGPGGIIDLVDSNKNENFLFVRIFSVSSGGLLLFGYGIALFRYFREQYGGIPLNKDIPEGK